MPILIKKKPGTPSENKPIPIKEKVMKTNSHIDREHKIETGKLKNLDMKKKTTHPKSCNCKSCKS